MSLLRKSCCQVRMPRSTVVMDQFYTLLYRIANKKMHFTCNKNVGQLHSCDRFHMSCQEKQDTKI